MKIVGPALALLLLSACAPTVPKAENVAANTTADDEVTEVQDETVVAANVSDNVAVEPE